MTNDQKVFSALSKIKEIKLLSLEVKELLNNLAVNDTVRTELNCDTDSLLSLLQSVTAELETIPSKTEDGIVMCSEFEKNRRTAFKNETHKNNMARKQYFDDERNAGSVGRRRAFHY